MGRSLYDTTVQFYILMSLEGFLVSSKMEEQGKSKIPVCESNWVTEKFAETNDLCNLMM
jgi:hypothetical protein